MSKKFFGILGIGLLFSSLFFYVQVNAEEYKDVDPEIKSIIKKFSAQGILNGFISRYGKGYFRPTATVKREDLIMALYEYDQVTRTLMEYQKVLNQKMRNLNDEVDKLKGQMASGQRRGGTGNIDQVMLEVQKNLPVLISNAPVPEKINQKLMFLENEVTLLKEGGKQGTASTGAISRIIRTSPQIKETIKNEVQEALGQLPQVSRGGGGSVDMKKIINEVKKDLPGLINNCPIPQKIKTEFVSIKEKLTLLEQLSEDIGEDLFANMLQNSNKVKQALKKEIKDINSKNNFR